MKNPKTNMESSKTPQQFQIAERLRRRRFTIAWWLWLILSVLLLLCLLPFLNWTTLWSPQMTLQTKGANANWMKIAEDGMQLLSFFSEDLGGYNNSHLTSYYAPISQNVYKFDFTGMCRVNTHINDMACHEGAGFDIVSSIITDFGIQVGYLGLADNPKKFGETLNEAYKSNLHELHRIVQQEKKAKVADLDDKKLVFLSRMMASEVLGKLLLSVWIAHLVCAFSLTCVELYYYVSIRCQLSYQIKPSSMRAVFILLFAFCLFTSLWTWLLETGFVIYMNKTLKKYGLYFTVGFGYSTVILQIIFEIFLGWSIMS